MWTSKAVAGLCVVAALGLTAHTQPSGRPAVTGAGETGPPSIAPVARTMAQVGGPDPVSVVEEYYAAINRHDYSRAWDLGGSRFARSYEQFVAGFADTAADEIRVDSVTGESVQVHLHAVHTDGSTADYAGSYTVRGGTLSRASLHRVGVGGFSRPVPGGVPGALDPAVTQSTIHYTICVRGWTAAVRPPSALTEQLKRRQLAASGVSDKNPAHYEEDHIIPLELGGAASDPANLRPVPVARARVDDRLENSLHRAVCAGSLTLPVAQTRVEEGKAAEVRP
ncbi:hypothetical protein PO587_05620 [Streptomyces gilvifuscus]|uniref:HNH endonuclease n=1 Tax=Streptomyces gilvifuscus TaxID=1550617 RepID=A0ABT5FN71_9ACTN|nr:hypothetical protein [Streptomyces gilvifuscus]MDC2953927.1 hypothetical protein [Streptomyces gilvifuscus]